MAPDPLLIGVIWTAVTVGLVGVGVLLARVCGLTTHAWCRPHDPSTGRVWWIFWRHPKNAELRLYVHRSRRIGWRSA